MYACSVSDYEFNSFLDRERQDLVFQSWQTVLQRNPLCENYRLYKHRLELEWYQNTSRWPERVKLTNFRCSSAASTVKIVIQKSLIETGPLRGSNHVPDEYHLLLNCWSVSAKSQQLLPNYCFIEPKLINEDQLINTSNGTLLKIGPSGLSTISALIFIFLKQKNH